MSTVTTTCHVDLPLLPPLDLGALSRFQHHLNARASDEQLAAFNKLDLFLACEVASRWASGRDYSLDRIAYERADELVGSNT